MSEDIKYTPEGAEGFVAPDNADREEDMLKVFECEPSQIARSIAEINEGTRAYVGSVVETATDPSSGEEVVLPEYRDVFSKLAGIEHVYTSFPEGKISRQDKVINNWAYPEKTLLSYLKDELVYTEGPIVRNVDEIVRHTRSEANVSLIRLRVGDVWKDDSNPPTTAQLYKRIKELGLEIAPTASLTTLLKDEISTVKLGDESGHKEGLNKVVGGGEYVMGMEKMILHGQHCMIKVRPARNTTSRIDVVATMGNVRFGEGNNDFGRWDQTTEFIFQAPRPEEKPEEPKEETK